MRTMVYREVLTGADSDILAGSEMETAPGTGVYIIRAASTVNTATLQVSGTAGAAVSSARAVMHRANGEILAADTPWIVPVMRGEKVTVGLAGTTGTVYLESLFVGR